MPPLTDPAIRAQFQSVLANWKYTGYVTGTERVLAWIATELPGLTLKDVARVMNAHAQSGGVLDQVPETREEWSEWPFHYDFRLPITGRMVYIETILRDDVPTDPTIHIVSMHDV